MQQEMMAAMIYQSDDVITGMCVMLFFNGVVRKKSIKLYHMLKLSNNLTGAA